jgi:hypothetical protein
MGRTINYGRDDVWNPIASGLPRVHEFEIILEDKLIIGIRRNFIYRGMAVFDVFHFDGTASHGFHDSDPFSGWTSVTSPIDFVEAYERVKNVIEKDMSHEMMMGELLDNQLELLWDVPYELTHGPTSPSATANVVAQTSNVPSRFNRIADRIHHFTRGVAR